MNKAIVIGIILVVTVATGITISILYPRSGGEEKQLQGLILQGAGSTFIYPQMSEWMRRFQEKYGIQVSYQGVGSGAGLSMFFQKVVDFACSDPPLSRDTWLKYQGSVMQIPIIFGSVVVIYNIPDIPRNITLRLDAVALARIYKGEIRYWDDEYIKSLNPDIAHLLPHKEIIAVYRSDSSGTTELFTFFLYKASKGEWPKELVGKSINWPVTSTGRGVGGKGSEGVTLAVMQTPYSIGYVEWSYAIKNNLSIAAIRNAEGNFVLPTRETLEEALRNAKIPTSPLDDFSEILNGVIYTPGAKSYPILGPTHIILWKRYDDPRKAEALKLFLKWLADEGYNYVLEGYVAPPQVVKDLLLKAVNEIAAG